MTAEKFYDKRMIYPFMENLAAAGLVFQSIVCLTSSLRGPLVKLNTSLKTNTVIFFC